ncbi:MAG: hypothetical protein ACLQBK_11920 [Candidatus Sulfotelmatobacter sp.]
MSGRAILAIIIAAMAASGVLMMRFRKRWLAKINIAFTNRITGLFAGWLPGFGILTHVGRKSGKVYRTPINVFRASNGFILAHVQQPIGVGEERPCGGRLRTKNSREEISAFRTEGRARSYAATIPHSCAARTEDRGCG